MREHAEKRAQKVFSLDRLRLYECPLSYLTDETVEIIRLTLLIDRTGILLSGSGWGGQPPWLVEAFEVYLGECRSVRRHEQTVREGYER